MKRIVYGLMLTLLPPTVAVAQWGEDTCHSPICILTGRIIFLFLVIAFFFTLLESIFEHGFVAGIIKHKGVRFLSIYLLGIGALIGFTLTAESLFGKNVTIVLLLVAMVVLYKFLQRYEDKRRSNNSDSENDSD